MSTSSSRCRSPRWSPRSPRVRYPSTPCPPPSVFPRSSWNQWTGCESRWLVPCLLSFPSTVLPTSWVSGSAPHPDRLQTDNTPSGTARYRLPGRENTRSLRIPSVRRWPSGTAGSSCPSGFPGTVQAPDTSVRPRTWSPPSSCW